MATFSVGEVADRFGVTVRTLHHYDAIGLLVPSERTPAGYRRYTEADLRRLQQIVVYRRLQFPLEQVATLLAEDSDVVGHLQRQRAAVLSRLDELRSLVGAIDTALEKAMSNEPLTRDELKDLLGEGFSDEYQQEARERWGDTDAWKESAQRTRRYTRADWEALKAEAAHNGSAMMAALRSGQPPTSEAAMDAAEAARRHIDRWFYPCSHAMHRALADMYVSDARFTKTYEDQAPGLAQYTRDAIHANANRHEG